LTAGSKKRIHELAKEWNVQPKDVLAKIERLGIRNKKSQSSLTDEQIAKVREALGLRDKAAVAIGTERVVSERVVTEKDAAEEQMVTSREQVVENRVRANVIRRRTTRVEVLKREEIATPEEPVAAEPEALAPIATESFEEPVLPAFTEEPEAAPSPVAEKSIEVAPPAEVAAELPEEAPVAPARHEAPPVEAEAPSMEAAPASEAAASAPAAPSAQRLDDAPQTVRVLGRIDLKKAVPPAPGPRRTETADRAGASARPRPGGAPAPADPGRAAPADLGKKKKRKVIKKADMLETLERDRRPGGKLRRKKRALPGKEQHRTEITTPKASKRVVKISEAITVGDLSKAIGVKSSEVIRKLMDMGMMATVNQVLDHDTATLVAAEFDYSVENVALNVESLLDAGTEEAADSGEREPRPPVVTIMGHVDHGKTSLLDAIRQANVTAGEAGGITQHIGAYSVEVGNRRVTFLDTPGHEAFTQMRARGAKVTDLVVLVVAADDSIMPQTQEAIDHARAAEVPIVVAINKIDKPDADVERVTRDLAGVGLAPENWGGDTIVVPVSAKTKEGIPQLLEMLLLQADVLEVSANANRRARGAIVEAKLDRGRGPVATVLVQEGTLKVGDAFVCGLEYGRVRAMLDDRGRKVDSVGPSTPVEILGLTGVPAAGDTFVAVSDEAKARQVAEHRRAKQRESELATTSKVSLEDLYQQIQAGGVKALKVVLKADVQGSVEAIRDALTRLSTDEVKLSVIHASVGGINESDVLLAAASNAIVIGFNVRPESKAADLAGREGVDIRLYNIIYEVVNDVRDALEGMLEPTLRERVLGKAEIRQIFTIPSAGRVAGSFVTDGKIVRGAKARIVRDNVVVHDGKIGTLRRFKDDAREVAAGYECGLTIENFPDIKEGDVVEVYEMEEVARHLAPTARSGAGSGQTQVEPRA
jgi:translation initiation factor IF-2